MVVLSDYVCKSACVLAGLLASVAATFHPQLSGLFWLVFYGHLLESLVAAAVCLRLGLSARATAKWVGSVMVCGLWSLRILVDKWRNM